MAFDIRSVGGTQIAGDHTVGRDVDFQMLAGNARVVDNDVAAGATTQNRLLLSEQILAAIDLQQRAILALLAAVSLKLPLARSRSSSKITTTGPTNA